MPESKNTMTAEQFTREKNYGAAMAVARMMRSNGVISERDYSKIEKIFSKKYTPISAVLSQK